MDRDDALSQVLAMINKPDKQAADTVSTADRDFSVNTETHTQHTEPNFQQPQQPQHTEPSFQQPQQPQQPHYPIPAPIRPNPNTARQPVINKAADIPFKIEPVGKQTSYNDYIFTAWPRPTNTL